MMSTPFKYIQTPVLINTDGIFIGDEKMPGCIARDGITVRPSGNKKHMNKLVVEFLVGNVTITDPWLAKTQDDDEED